MIGKTSTFVIFIALTFLHAAFGQTEVRNANEVIEKSIQALGGKNYLLSIKTLYTDMTFEMEGKQYHMITKEQFPNKIITEIKSHDSVILKTIYNGKSGYKIENGKKIILNYKEFENNFSKKNIFNALDYLDSTLWKLELLREDKIGNEEVYKIAATSMNNSVIRFLYYSKISSQLIEEVEFQNKNDDDYYMTNYSEYKNFGKLTFYSVVKFHDGPVTREYKIVHLLVNEKITNDEFN